MSHKRQTCNAVSLRNSTQRIFHELQLNAGEKMGLIGDNSASTLLKLLSKALEPSVGSVTHAQNLNVYQVEQTFPTQLKTLSLLDTVLDLVEPSERPSLSWPAESYLMQMDFLQQDSTFTCNQFSGGQQTRILLARVCQPHVLLLDEPSNHLDLAHFALARSLFTRLARQFYDCLSRRLDAVTNCTWIMAPCIAIPLLAAKRALHMNNSSATTQSARAGNQASGNQCQAAGKLGTGPRQFAPLAKGCHPALP